MRRLQPIGMSESSGRWRVWCAVLAGTALTIVSTIASAATYSTLPPPASAVNAPLTSYLPELAAGRPSSLAGVPIAWVGSTSPLIFVSTDATPSIDIPTAVSAPVAVHLFMGSRNTGSQARRLGTVRLRFDDGSALETVLQIGTNIREWRPRDGEAPTVNRASDRRVVEVHRERLRTNPVGRLDRLTIPIESIHRHRTLAGVSITDEVSGSVAPGVLLVAVTVERLPQFITFIKSGEVWISEADGANERPLTSGCRDCANPSLAPNATSVLYVARSEASGNLQILQVGLGGGQPVAVYDLEPDAVVPSPRFTDDGTHILFHRRYAAGRPTDLFRLSLTENGGPQRLTKTAGRDEVNPTPAPDNDDIAYASRGRLYLRDGKTGRRRSLLRPRGKIKDPDQPVFSPDGTRVVFRARTCDAAGACSTELFSVPREGGPATQVTRGMNDAASPAFVDEGTKIVAAARGAAWRIDAASGAQHLIVENAAQTGAETGDGLECLQPIQAVACYHPYRIAAATTLRMSPAADALPVLDRDGTAVVLAPGTVFGVQSQAIPGGCPRTAVPSIPALSQGDHIWGYVDVPSASGRRLAGWVAATAVTRDDAITNLCGLEGADFQCNVGPGGCRETTRCDGSPLPISEPDIQGGECNSKASQLVYAAPGFENPLGGPPLEAAGPPIGWLVPKDHLAYKRRSIWGEWQCVEILLSKNANPRYGWIHTQPDFDSWCGGPTCGDGKVDPADANESRAAESCDDFNADNCDECPNNCHLECEDGSTCSQRANGLRCADGTLCNQCGDGISCPGPGRDDVPGRPAATCDDGNTDDKDQCTQYCSPPSCGDGLLNYQLVNGTPLIDQCEDGNTNPHDACVGCQNARCGDGWLRTDHNPATGQPYEQCGDEGAGCSRGASCINCLCVVTDNDLDGESAASDCNDYDPSIHHGAPDPCEDGVDQDCNGSDCQYWHSCTVHCSTESLTSVLQNGVYGRDYGYCIQWAQAQCRQHPWQDAWRVYFDGAGPIHTGTRVCCAKCRNRQDAYNMNTGSNCAGVASNWCNQSGRGGLDPNTPWYNPGAFWGACS